MKNSLMALALTLLMPAASILAAAGPSPREDKIAQQVRAVERQRVQALTTNDLAALERLLADDLTYTHSTGAVDSKTTFLASLRSGDAKYETMEHDDLRVRTYGETAVLTGRTRVKVKSRGEDLSLQLRFTLVYAKRAGRWQMVAWQSTRLPAQ
jgi:ketosteroid isomerase-like protein